MDFTFDRPYLLLPVSSLAQYKRLLFLRAGQPVYDLWLPLDFDRPQTTFYLDVRRFRGQTLTLETEPAMPLPLQASDTGLPPAEQYAGRCRPLAHFTARRGWLNDPNGLVLYEGRYHMFFQHNPVGTAWENMHWGHAVSTDLVHWQEQPIALFPTEEGTVFSGSAVIDHGNRTGLQENEHEVLLLFYTAAGSTSRASAGRDFTQNLAYSTDGGVTFRRYAGNPLIAQAVPGNRDPKVIYHPGAGRYIMAFYLDGHQYALYSSADLLHWEPLQRLALPGDTECPDFYPLPVDGDEGRLLWVFIGASGRYLLGEFDGQAFRPATMERRQQYGGAYAFQSWSGLPGLRRVCTGFATVTIPGEPFGGCMNLPAEMRLKTFDDGIWLCAEPVPELRNLYRREETLPDGGVCRVLPGRSYDLSLRLAAGADAEVSAFGLSIRYDAARKELSCLDRAAPVHAQGGVLTLRILWDTAYTEIFADDGRIHLGIPFTADHNLNTLRVVPQAQGLHLAELAPFWEG